MRAEDLVVRLVRGRLGVHVEQPLQHGQVLPPPGGRTQPARGRAVLQHRHPVAAVQVVLGDRGSGPNRGVQHRRRAVHATGAARLGEHVQQHHHLGVPVRERRRDVQLAGPQRHPPVDTAQPVAGCEHAYPGQLAALPRPPRPVRTDQPGGPGHRLDRVERLGTRIDPGADRFGDHRAGDQQPVGGGDPHPGRPDRVPPPPQRRAGQLQVDGAAPGYGGDERAVRPAGAAHVQPGAAETDLLHAQPARHPGPHHRQVVPDQVRVGDGDGRGQRRALDQVGVPHAEFQVRQPGRTAAQRVRGAQRERRGEHHQVDAAEQDRRDEQHAGEQHGPAERPGGHPAARRLGPVHQRPAA